MPAFDAPTQSPAQVVEAVRNRHMSSRGSLTLDTATALIQRYVDPGRKATRVRKLHGGMVNKVYEILMDPGPDPASVVAKLNTHHHEDLFRHEYAVLKWYRKNTRLPVPEPIAVIADDPDWTGSGILMEYINGLNLAEARVSPTGFSRVQRHLAQFVAELHDQRRDTYGSVFDPRGHERWLDVFRPMMHAEFEYARDLLSTNGRRTIEHTIDNLEKWLPESGSPRLVHGDLWATNVLVDDAHPHKPNVLAFIDCGATYADPEYELAYLSIFRTIDEQFFRLYRRRHTVRKGFHRRCRIYWLNTMLLHVRVFGDQYIPPCEDLAAQIRRLQ